MKTRSYSAVTLLLLLILSLGFTSIQAQTNNRDIDAQLGPKGEINLDNAISIALANNPQVNRALLAIDDANELVKVAYSEVLPDISSFASLVRNIEIPQTFLPAQIFDPTAPPDAFVPVAFGTDNNWNGGFSVDQTIFRGEALIGISSSTIFKKVQEEVYRSTAQQIVTLTRVAYYQVLIAKESVRLQEAQIARLEENLRDNEARFRAGLIEEYDVLRIRVQLSNQRPQLIEAEYALDEAYRNLNAVMGIPINMQLTASGDLNSYDFVDVDNMIASNESIFKVDQMNPYVFQAEEVSEGENFQDRGDLRVIDAQIGLKDREITAIRSRFLPTITANYNLLWSANEPGALNPFRNPEPFTDPIRSQTLGVTVSLPLFEGLERISNVNRAKIQRKDLLEQQREAELNAINEITTAKENLNKSFETADARKQALEEAQRGYTIAKSRFDNGLGSQLDVSEAEIQVRQAELNYASLIFNYLTAKAQYDLAVGLVPYVDITIDTTADKSN